MIIGPVPSAYAEQVFGETRAYPCLCWESGQRVESGGSGSESLQ